MSSSGIGVARAPEDSSRIQTQQPAVPETAVTNQVRQAAHWFFWLVAVTAMDSLFVLLGGRIHRFTGLGVTALADSFTGANPVGHLIANGWLATLFLFLGYCALEGRKSAFAIGLGVYACDAALLVVAHDYFCIPFHAFVLYQLYRGFAAFPRGSSSQVA